MKSTLIALGFALATVVASPVSAALAVGDQAPDFTINATQSGTTISIHLADLLKQGPVVLYFMPSSFSHDSAVETRAFADNIDAFRAAGATVLGMARDTADGIDTLARFATETGAGKFPLAAASLAIVDGFAVNDGAQFNTRTTYVITPAGRIAFVYDNDEPGDHVKNSLAFVQGMKK